MLVPNLISGILPDGRGLFPDSNTFPPREHAGERKPLVLIVDDDRELSDLLAVVLRTEGYRVSSARDGAEALSKTVYLAPDLIVMDLCLPRLDGYSVIERLKAHSETRRIPVLALTGHGTEVDAGRRAREAGCDAFFTKPLALEKLVVTIRAMVTA